MRVQRGHQLYLSTDADPAPSGVGVGVMLRPRLSRYYHSPIRSAPPCPTTFKPTHPPTHHKHRTCTCIHRLARARTQHAPVHARACSWESFLLSKFSDGSIALQNFAGGFLSPVNPGSTQWTFRSHCLGWERLRFDPETGTIEGAGVSESLVFSM